MESINWLHATLTIAGLFCFIGVWHEYADGRLSRRATLLVLGIGPFSWALQMLLVSHMNLADAETSLYLFWCTVLAIVCFITVILANQIPRVRGRDIAQAIIWGQFMYPLVLMSFLPEGTMTFIRLLKGFL